MTHPITVSSKPATEEPVDRVICGICRRQFSKYACPTCNIAYCSLTCFRSESHSRCSETFYRKEVETGIQSQQSKSAEEKLKMIELLKRLEEESQEDDLNLLEEDGEEVHPNDDLAQRLNGLDIESASHHALWSILTPDEREKFTRAVENPSSELAQQLLSSEELESKRLAPWWEAPLLDDVTQNHSAKRYGDKPEVMLIPFSIPTTSVTSPPLIYNICAVCIAYAYTTRYLSVSPLSSLKTDDEDFQEALRIISQLVPALTDRRSKVLHLNLSSVVADIWSRFELEKIDAKLFSLLLRDAARLLRPPVVTVLSSVASTSQRAALSTELGDASTLGILVLSDLFKVFELGLYKTASDKTGLRFKHATLKLCFYAAQVLSTPSAILSHVADEVMAQSMIIEEEAVPSPSNTVSHSGSFSGSRVSIHAGITGTELREDEKPIKSKIEELN